MLLQPSKSGSGICIFRIVTVLSWKEPEPPPPDPNAVKPPMITEILQMEEEEAMAKVTAAANELADKLQGGAVPRDFG